MFEKSVMVLAFILVRPVNLLPATAPISTTERDIGGKLTTFTVNH